MGANRRRSPQEKKQLSYSRDRRNWYGENDKCSRRSIARRKRIRHRSARHREHQDLMGAVGPVDTLAGADAEERLARRRKPDSYWRKWPDAQLGAYVIARLSRRVTMGISSAPTEQARIDRVWHATVFDRVQPPSKWNITPSSPPRADRHQ